MALLADLIEVLLKNRTDRIALAIFFASLIAFLLMLVPGEIGALTRSHWQWPFWGLLGSVCYLPTKHILQFVEEKDTQRKAKKQQRERTKRLHELTQHERDCLKPYIQNGKRAHYFGWQTIADARSLIEPGVLIETSTQDGSKAKAFEIAPWAYSYLCEHPELVGLSPQNSN